MGEHYEIRFETEITNRSSKIVLLFKFISWRKTHGSFIKIILRL